LWEATEKRAGEKGEKEELLGAFLALASARE